MVCRKYISVILFVSITKTSPCNVQPLTSHFYIVKLGFTGVYILFLFLLQNMDCGYSLETPHLKMNIFTAVKYCCILHGRVWVVYGQLVPSQLALFHWSTRTFLQLVLWSTRTFSLVNSYFFHRSTRTF